MTDDREFKNGDFKEYRRLILAEIERLSSENNRLDALLRKLSTEIVELRTQSHIWSGMIGAIVGTATSTIVTLILVKVLT